MNNNTLLGIQYLVGVPCVALSVVVGSAAALAIHPSTKNMVVERLD